MTQIVLMLYEDPKADPLSEKRFHVEMHFCPGAKTIDDPEFLARSSPTRKRSQEDLRHLSSSKTSTEVPDEVIKTRKLDETGKSKSEQYNMGVSGTVDSLHSGLKSSSPNVTTTDANTAQSEESALSSKSPDETTSAATQNPGTEEETISKSDEFEPYSDKAFDETVYAGNERPRCAIGIEDYSDTALGASTGDSEPSSGMSIEETSGEEQVVVRQRSSLSEGDLHCSGIGDGGLPSTSVISKQERITKSDSDISVFTTPKKGAWQACHETSSITCIVEQDESKHHVTRVRPKSHSISGSHPIIYTAPAPTSESPDDLSVHKFSQGKFI